MKFIHKNDPSFLSHSWDINARWSETFSTCYFFSDSWTTRNCQSKFWEDSPCSLSWKQNARESRTFGL